MVREEKFRGGNYKGAPGDDGSAARATFAWQEMERIFTQEAEAASAGRFAAIVSAFRQISARLPFSRRAWAIAASGLCLFLLLGGTWFVLRMAGDHLWASPGKVEAVEWKAMAPDDKPFVPRAPERCALSGDGTGNCGTIAGSGPVGDPPPPPAAAAKADSSAPKLESGMAAAKASEPDAAPVHKPLQADRADALQQASKGLAEAYALALHANVDPQYLGLYSQRWSMLRENAAGDPDGTAAAYRIMTVELERLARDTRGAQP